MSNDDGLHEAEIYEWELEKRFENESYRERYFIKTVKYRLLRQLKQDGWWCKHVERFPDLTSSESSVTMRTFDEVGYDRLLQHVCYMLSLDSDIAMEMFLLRVHGEMRWKEIKRKMYPDMPKTEFEGYVKTIKDTARESAMLSKESRWIVSLLR